MTLKSMTGFARASGHSAPWRWAWELKSVNSKGLDLRLRAPAPFDRIEIEARARLSAKFTRGAIQASLSVQRDELAPEVRVNENVLRLLVEAISRVPPNPAIGPASLDGLLGVRGVLDIREASDDEATLAGVSADILAGLDAAAIDMAAFREREGAALGAVLAQRLDRIAALVNDAETCAGRKPEAVKARLAQMLATLGEASRNLDPHRLHQEAVLMAAKADIREELDRLVAHVAAARDLLGSGAPAGRKLDFLAQEFGREANTLCSKSNDVNLTQTGMELRVEIEQFREQVQNIE